MGSPGTPGQERVQAPAPITKTEIPNYQDENGLWTLLRLYCSSSYPGNSLHLLVVIICNYIITGILLTPSWTPLLILYSVQYYSIKQACPQENFTENDA